MGLNTFTTALSGLATNTQGLNVVGNNLANMNTVGFKTQTVSFTDILGQTVAGSSAASSANVGLGSKVGQVSSVFSQGGFETTNRETDVAIQGKGFFVVNNGEGNFYTRAGNFSIDADGNLVDPSGFRVQGYTRDPNTGLIDTSGLLSDVRIPASTGFSNPTGAIELALNLDAAAPVGEVFNTSIQVYDSLGEPHVATIRFVKDSVVAGETRWNFDVTMPHRDFEGIPSTSTDQFSLISNAVASATPDQGTVVFDSNGQLTSVFLGAPPATLPPAADQVIPGAGLPLLANGGAMMPNDLLWRFISANGEPNVSGLARASAVSFNNQDGVPPGSMSSISIQPDGTVTGIFDNGLTIDIARLGLAQFRNENGMISRGNGLFVGSSASGAVLIGLPGQGGNGRLVGGAVELSNVDLATEFTKIITFQRGYQANARIITATDQILQETMNLRQ